METREESPENWRRETSLPCPDRSRLQMNSGTRRWTRCQHLHPYQRTFGPVSGSGDHPGKRKAGSSHRGAIAHLLKQKAGGAGRYQAHRLLVGGGGGSPRGGDLEECQVERKAAGYV